MWRSSRAIALAGLIAGSLLAVLLFADGWRVAPAASSALLSTPAPNGRFGFGLTNAGTITQVDYLNAGWYWDWAANGESRFPGLAYAQTVRLTRIPDDPYATTQTGYTASPTGTALLDAIAAQPGAVWFIGNEPDCNVMDNMLSEWYARAYHDLYSLIKAADPTARVAAGNIVQPTPQRLLYLDRVLAAYRRLYSQPLPADLWAVHAYILCECCYPSPAPGEPFPWGACWVPDWMGVNDLESYKASRDIATAYSVYDHWRVDIFAQRLQAFRQWMSAHGYRDHPLVVPEYGILFYEGLVSGMTLADDVRFMVEGFDWMRSARDPEIGYLPDGARLVQQWAWYSLSHDAFYLGGSLFTDGVPTLLGTAYHDYTELLSPSPQPRVNAIWGPAVLGPAGEPATTTVTARVSNAGDADAPAGLTVRLSVTSPISRSLGWVQTQALGCCGDGQEVSVSWTAPGDGLYRVCATASTADLSSAPACGEIWIHPPYSVMLPTVQLSFR